VVNVKRADSAAWLLAIVILSAGCSQQLPPVPNPQTSECSPADVGTIWPQLQEVKPDEVAPGDEIKIIASGGYEIECGSFYNESHRLFEIYFDQDQVGMLSCMTNHCEAMVNVPKYVQPGKHIISTEGGSQIEIEIIENRNLDPLNGVEVLAGTTLPASLKGYELYSWFGEEGWQFTLITGTNRIKSVEEIILADDVVDHDGWVRITASGVQELKSALDKLPGSQEIFWVDGSRVAGAGEDTIFSLPPEDIIQQVQQHSDQLELKLHIVR
jgi:hypothetical protein